MNKFFIAWKDLCIRIFHLRVCVSKFQVLHLDWFAHRLYYHLTMDGFIFSLVETYFFLKFTP